MAGSFRLGGVRPPFPSNEFHGSPVSGDDATETAVTAEPAHLLTPTEAAGLLRMNISTLYPLLARGVIPGARKVGGVWRISRRVLLESFTGNASSRSTFGEQDER